MHGEAQVSVPGPFSTLPVWHNCLELLRIAFSDLHSPSLSMFFTNQEEEGDRQNAITQGGSVMHNRSMPPSEGAAISRPKSDCAHGMLIYNEF